MIFMSTHMYSSRHYMSTLQIFLEYCRKVFRDVKVCYITDGLTFYIYLKTFIFNLYHWDNVVNVIENTCPYNRYMVLDCDCPWLHTYDCSHMITSITLILMLLIYDCSHMITCIWSYTHYIWLITYECSYMTSHIWLHTYDCSHMIILGNKIWLLLVYDWSHMIASIWSYLY